MKLPELLKKAVLTQDWKTVCLVYTAITGEPLAPPEPKKEPNLLDMEISDELIEQLGIDNSQDENASPSNLEDAVLAATDQENVKKKEISRDDTRSFISKIYDGDGPGFSKKKEDGKVEAKKVPLKIPKERLNKFNDDLSVDSRDLKANNKQLEKLYGTVSKHSSRLVDDENEIVKIDVVCSLCGELDQVVKGFAIGYNTDPEANTYRCTSCSTPSGRAKALRKQKELSGPSRRN